MRDNAEQNRKAVVLTLNTKNDAEYVLRKKGHKRRDLFLKAGMRAFMRNGFAGTSLKDIVDEAGGSLATLYRMFGNKEGLFQAVIEQKFETVFGPGKVFDLSGKPVESALRDVGQGLMDMILSDEALAMHRLMTAEAGQVPHLRQSFLDTAANRGKQALADYFVEETSAGRLMVPDCDLAAAQFLGLVKGDILMRRLLGEDLRMGLAEREALVDNAVALFLRGVLPR